VRGLVFGLFMAGFAVVRIGRQRQSDLDLIGGHDPEAWRAVHEALRSGELPADTSHDLAIGRVVVDRRRTLDDRAAWWWVTPAAGAASLVAGLFAGTSWLVVGTVLLVVAAVQWRRREGAKARLDGLITALLSRPRVDQWGR